MNYGSDTKLVAIRDAREHKQAGGNPEAIYDMVDGTAKEGVVDKRQRHEAGIKHLDFTWQ